MATPNLTKVAIIRKPGYPVGHPAPCYLNCPCGAQPALRGTDYVPCPCGAVYDAAGWLVNSGGQS